MWEVFCLWLLDHQLLVCNFYDHQVVILFLRFVLGFAPTLLCRGMREIELCNPISNRYNSSVEVPLWKVLGEYSGNSFVWRWGRRAVARTSKYILVFVFGSFSFNSLLFISHIAIIVISIFAWCYLCTHTCVFASLHLLFIDCITFLIHSCRFHSF